MSFASATGEGLTAAIIHGSFGSPTENWFPWLKMELERRSIPTIVPQFPTPEGQSLDSWRERFSAEVGEIHENLVLFGHSTGVALLLNLLQEAKAPARATYLVAGFVGDLNQPVFDPLNRSFFAGDFQWDCIRANAGDLFVFSGDDDPYVPLEKGVELARLLQSELVVVPNGGHLNSAAGFTTFPALLNNPLSPRPNPG